MRDIYTHISYKFYFPLNKLGLKYSKCFASQALCDNDNELAKERELIFNIKLKYVII